MRLLLDAELEEEMDSTDTRSDMRRSMLNLVIKL